MINEKQPQSLYEHLLALRATLINHLSDLSHNPQLVNTLLKQVDDMMALMADDDPNALGDVHVAQGVEYCDELFVSERLTAVADLYYIYQHEQMGVFRVLQMLQELFRSGALRLGEGQGAFALYQFDRREVLRYTRHDRYAAYGRVLGYGSGQPVGDHSNTNFHKLLSQFVNQVVLYWQDKQFSGAISQPSNDPSFGSIALVRRAALDLRNNLKQTTYPHLHTLRVELTQLLEEAFAILKTEDVKQLFGAANPWEVIETVSARYFNEHPEVAPRQVMALAGREIVSWLSQPNILEANRVNFESVLLEITEYAVEWHLSAESIAELKRKGSKQTTPRNRPLIIPGNLSSSPTND